MVRDACVTGFGLKDGKRRGSSLDGLFAFDFEDRAYGDTGAHKRGAGRDVTDRHGVQMCAKAGGD